MSKIKDDSALRRTRATWLARKLDINFTRASNIVMSKDSPTTKESKKITKILKEESRAPLYVKHPYSKK